MANSKNLLYILGFLLGLSLVMAAGGGGGGGGSSSVEPSSNSLKCDDKGQLTFQQKSRVEPVIISNLDDGTVIKAVPGVWDGTVFTSEEAVFVKKGKYLIPDEKNGNKTVECPGLKFSCKIVQLQVEDCTIADGHLVAHFTLNNADINDLKYDFTLDSSRKLTYAKNSYSKELEDLKISKTAAKYELLVPSFTSEAVLQIAHPQCVGKYYVYAKVNCYKKENTNQINKQEMKQDASVSSGKKLKCGGYLDINDRVKCRLQLREEQREEYENFFPEECKARTGAAEQEKCLKVYQAVQECWDFPNGQARITCVKRVLKLGDILIEKANCNALDSGKRENCNLELREKVYALVKFRLYNLEEEAEEFMEERKLSLDEVTAFVVKMEQHKLAFNTADSKDARKSVLVSARQDWLDLLRKVKE